MAFSVLIATSTANTATLSGKDQRVFVCLGDLQSGQLMMVEQRMAVSPIQEKSTSPIKRCLAISIRRILTFPTPLSVLDLKGQLN
jgi:hypothetical protein